METFSIASLPDDDMVVTLVRSAAGCSSRDVPEEGCSFLVIRKDVVYMSNCFDMYGMFKDAQLKMTVVCIIQSNKTAMLSCFS